MRVLRQPSTFQRPSHDVFASSGFSTYGSPINSATVSVQPTVSYAREGSFSYSSYAQDVFPQSPRSVPASPSLMPRSTSTSQPSTIYANMAYSPQIPSNANIPWVSLGGVATVTGSPVPHDGALDSAGDPSGKVLPWLTPDVVVQRARRMGLLTAEAMNFATDAEFVSLGCFCGVTRALQSLDLKRFSYPFDWARSDAAGVLHCIQNRFRNFASYSTTGEHFAAMNKRFYGGSQWGGSFWHHDPSDPATRDAFQRRADRFTSSNGEVSSFKTRVFAIACNSSGDLLVIPDLMTALECMFPYAKVYLIVFIDNQKVQGPVRLVNRSNVLFFRTSEELFRNNGQSWTEQKHAEKYAEGLAFAIKIWAGIPEGWNIPEVSSCQELHRACSHFYGGDPSRELYWPAQVGHPIYPKKPTRAVTSHNSPTGDEQCSLQ